MRTGDREETHRFMFNVVFVLRADVHRSAVPVYHKVDPRLGFCDPALHGHVFSHPIPSRLHPLDSLRWILHMRCAMRNSAAASSHSKWPSSPTSTRQPSGFALSGVV